MSFKMDRDKWLAALTGFTPFGKGPMSVSWLKEHPRERKAALAAAAIVGAAYTGGASLGALGGAGGAAAAGAAEAGAGAAAGMGSGLAAADYAALGLGAPAVEGGAGLAAGAGSGITAADYAALQTAPGLFGGGTPAPFYGGELASVGETGGTMLGGAAPVDAQAAIKTPGLFDGMADKLTIKNAMRGLNAANTVTKALAPPPPPKPLPMPRQPAPESYGSFVQAAGGEPRPGDPGYEEYMRRKYGNRS